MTVVTSPRIERTRASLGWRRALLSAIALAVLLLTTWIWVRSGGLLQTFVYPEYLIESQALYTGLMSSALMVLQVLMLARIPWVEQAWGHDSLARWHRLAGLWSFWLMLAHVLLFAIARVQREPDSPLGALWAVFIGDSWMLLASLGTLMIIAVVATSIRAARRRLRYESWHLLHLYAYLGMALAFPHQLFDGTHFHEWWTQAFWWFLFLAALAATLVWRIAVPLAASRHHQLRVATVTGDVPGAVSITMTGHDLDRLHTRSGQFFIWRFIAGPGWTRGHPYSLSAAPGPDQLRITLDIVGDGSARAATIQPGTPVWIEGPYGTMTEQLRRHPRMVLIAAGVGVTPFRSILEDAQYGPGEATLLYRVRSAAEAPLLNELTALCQRRGADLHILSGRRRAAGSWLPEGSPDHTDTQHLQALVPDITACDVFVCGPPAWSRSVQHSLREAGAHQSDIHLEDYGW